MYHLVLVYEGPKPSDTLIRRCEKIKHHPQASEIEPCPWEGLFSTNNHELIVIPGPPEVLYNKIGITDAEMIENLEDRGFSKAYS